MKNFTTFHSRLVLAVVVFTITVAMSATAWGQLLTEEFNFSGALTSNGWSAHSAGGTNALSTTTGLTYSGYASSGIGNAVLVDNLGGEDDNRGLSPEQSGNGTVVYFSFLVRVTDTSTSKTGEYFFHSGNRTAPGTFTTFAARVFARIVSGNVNFGLSNSSTATWDSTNFSKNTTYLLIVKYTINTGGNDTTKLWVVSAGVPASEGAAGTATVTNSVTAGQDTIDAIALRQGSSTTQPQVVVDGIRIGTSWTDAVTASSAPTVTTSAATSVASTTATLNGTVNANWASTTVTFDYGATISYGNSVTAAQSPVTGNTNAAVSAAVSALAPNTLHHFRAVGVNSQGTTNDSDLTFTTLPSAPTATAATSLTTTSFVANWTAGTGGADSYRLDVSTDISFGSFVAGYNNLVVAGTSQSVTGLTPGPTHYYRVRAVGVGGTSANSNVITVAGTCAANTFTPAAGSWSDSANWSAGHVPQPGDSVIISGTVTVSSLPYDSICALTVFSGGTLTFSPGVGTLKIAGNVTIDTTGGTINLDNNQFTCYGDWDNNGTYNAGTSTLTLAGDSSRKIKGSSTTTFYNLGISGANKSTKANITISGSLVLQRTLDLRAQDTMTVTNSSTSAISDTGKIPQGTIKRAISASGLYRFESESTYVQFVSGTLPSFLTITTIPSAAIDTTSEYQSICSVPIVDTTNNTVRCDTIGDFSIIKPGIPNVGLRKMKPYSDFDTLVHREYIVNASGGGSFVAKIQLRYENSEVPAGVNESELKLLRKSYVSVDIVDGWNMVSVPLQKDNYWKSDLFPTSTSNAFRYSSGYVMTDPLSNGPGYWLKFSGDQTVGWWGGPITSMDVTVNAKWNLIGSISKSIATSSITSTPSGIIVSGFYGFDAFFGYTSATTITPGKGYWVKTNANGTLHLTSSASVPEKASDGLNSMSLNRLTIMDGLSHKQALYLAEKSELPISPTTCEMPPPSPIGFDARFRSQRIVETYSIEDEQIGSYEFPIDIQTVSHPITIQWDIKKNNGKKFVLSDGVEGEIFRDIIMERTGSYEIQHFDLKSIVIKLTEDLDVIPKEFALYQNYPNPFNPSTRINFDLPVDANVTIKVYNIVGQEVGLLVSQKFYRAGGHSVVLNTSNFVSGVYFYQMNAHGIMKRAGETVDFQDVKKMSVVR